MASAASAEMPMHCPYGRCLGEQLLCSWPVPAMGRMSQRGMQGRMALLQCACVSSYCPGKWSWLGSMLALHLLWGAPGPVNPARSGPLGMVAQVQVAEHVAAEHAEGGGIAWCLSLVSHWQLPAILVARCLACGPPGWLSLWFCAACGCLGKSLSPQCLLGIPAVSGREPGQAHKGMRSM